MPVQGEVVGEVEETRGLHRRSYLVSVIKQRHSASFDAKLLYFLHIFAFRERNNFLYFYFNNAPTSGQTFDGSKTGLDALIERILAMYRGGGDT